MKHKHIFETKGYKDDLKDVIESKLQDFCNNGNNVVISKENLLKNPVESVILAQEALRRCGFVYLDSLYEPDVVANWNKSFKDFMKRENGGGDWRYPCQGVGRSEVMLPFESPFNDTSIYGNPYLRSILAHSFKGTFKMELQTVITSKPGSGNQRWHQGWRYLFDPKEGRQKHAYAIIVGVVCFLSFQFTRYVHTNTHALQKNVGTRKCYERNGPDGILCGLQCQIL